MVSLILPRRNRFQSDFAVPTTRWKGSSHQPYLEGPSYQCSSAAGKTDPRSSIPVEGDRRWDRVRGACCNSHLIK